MTGPMGPSDARPRIAGRYLLVEAIGEGGAGTVWRAHDQLLNREVAVKQLRLPPGLGPGELDQYAAAALAEARIAGRLSHPSIVKVHDVIQHDGVPWIVMDLVRGTSLDKLLPLPAARVVDIGLSVLDALEAAHAHGLLHRDVKPANILVSDDDGRAMLADFGIAAALGTDSLDSSGSPAYMAPERFRGEHPGIASDLWSLGATLYAAVEGAGPFRRDSPNAVVAAVLMHHPPPPRQASPGLAAAVMALLEKDPARRPPTPAVRHMLIAQRDTGPVAVRRRGPWPLIIGAVATVAFGVAAGLGTWWLTSSGSSEGSSAVSSSGAEPAGRFAVAPDACQSLTTNQVETLFGAQADDNQAGDSCQWVHRGGSGTQVTVTFRLSPPADGEAAAGRMFAAERAAAPQPSAVPDIGDEAFISTPSTSSTTGGSAAAVRFRRSNLIVEVGCAAADLSAARTTATQAAKLVSAGLG